MTTPLPFDRLLSAREVLGPHYGSEQLCMLLYVLARRERPEVVVELGTGLGVTTLWIAAALEENGTGHLWSVDNGAHLDMLDPEALDGAALTLGFDRGDSLHSFAGGLVDSCGLAHRVSFLDETVDMAASATEGASWPFLAEAIDWVFSDIRHGPETIEQLLATFLPSAAPCFSLFVDSASTRTSSFLVAERLIDQLNRAKIPKAFLEVGDATRRAALKAAVSEREFGLKHLIERRNQAQNSTMWITAFPNDWRPYPLTMMRGR